MNEVPEFKGNVKAFPVDVLVDKAARPVPELAERTGVVHIGSNRPYHYYGSAIWFNFIDHAKGDSMLELLNDAK
jgi:predicted N-formylglutamate amidohydrolase